MLEYIFFDERPWRDFIDFLKQLGLEVKSAVKEEGWLVYVSEELDDELDEKIEACYDRLLEQNERLIAEREGEDHVHTAGINVTLADGRIVQAAVDPKLMNRLLDAVSTDELGEFVSAIAHAVENGDERTLCQR